MLMRHSIDELIQNVQKFDRARCKAELRQFQHPSLDFSEEFLESLSTERLRHVLMAACLQARKTQAPKTH